jgi:hypothetical protein
MKTTTTNYKKGFLKALWLLPLLLLWQGFSTDIKAQETVHYWSFNEGENSGADGFPSPLSSDIGDAQLIHSYTSGLQSFGGTSDNAEAGFDSGAAFVIQGGTELENNGKSFSITSSVEDYEDIILSFAGRSTGTGFDNVLIEVSSDGGGSFTTVTNTSFDGWSAYSYNLTDALTTVNETSELEVRFTLTGATSENGNNRFDNLKLSGTFSGTVDGIGFFSLLSPPNGTQLPVFDGDDTEVVIEWEAAEAAETYTWVANLPGEGFDDPLLALPADNSASATTLTLTSGTLFTALSDLGIPAGTVAELEWTVIAENGLDEPRQANQVWEIALVAPAVVDDIAAFRAGDAGLIYQISSEAVVLHRDGFRGRHYVRDASGSLTIWNQGDVLTDYAIGDGVTGFIGTRNVTNNDALIYMETFADAGAPTSTGNPAAPAEFTIDELSLENTGDLVRINEVDFLDEGTFSTGSNYDFTDPSVDGSASFRTDFFGADYIDNPLPTETIDMVAIVGGFGSNFQVTARSAADFIEIGDPNQVATPSFDPAPGSFTDEVTVAISTTTPEATIYYTTDGSEPTTEDTEYTGPLTFTETTTLSARAYADSFDPSDVATGEYVIETATGISTIAELREQEGAGNVTFTGTAVLTYQQGFRNQKYIQDETGGIMIDDAAGTITTEYAVGDELGEITGEISVFGNMVQFVPAANPGAPLSSGNEPEPLEITLAELYDNFNTYQARLVTVEALSFDDAGAEFTNGTEYGITDINTSDAGIFRTTFFGVDYIGTEVPSAPQTITGLPNSREEGNFLTARNSADIIPFASDDQVVAPVIEPGSGLFTEPVEVTMSVDDEQASIYYTTDGSEPTQSSTLYTGAFTIDETTTVQARAFRSGFEPSGVVAATYSFPTEVTLAEARALPEGTAVIVSGLVTTPDFGFGNAEFYLQDDEAGIKVRWPGFGGGNDPDTPFAVGQELELTGTIGSRFEELLINPVDFEVLSSDNELPEATPIEDYGTQWTFDSALQGTRVSMLEVSLVDPSAWPVEGIDAGSGLTVQAQDAEGNIYDIRLDRDESFFDGSPVPPETFNLSGVLGRFQENAQLFPFFEEELQEPETDPRIQIIHNAADPALDEVDVYVNGSLLFDEVAFRSATPFFEAPASFTVALTAAGAPLEDAVFEADVELETGESYYVIAQGVLDPTAFEPNPDGEAISFGLDVISGALEESANASNFEFDIYHGVTDAPAVDVVARDIALLAADLGYLDVTDTAISVPADGYTLDINLAGTNDTVASFDADLSQLADQVGIVLASGFLNAGQGEAFGLLVTLPDGTTQVLEIATSIGDEPGDLPQEFALNQNYPNPFNPTTSIEYALPEATDVTLEVYNLQGQRVAVLVNGQQTAGNYNVSFDARNLASGMYLYRLQAGSYVQVQKMMLLK